MERLTMQSNKGGLAFTFDLDISCERSEIEKIIKLGEKLKAYEDAEEQGLLIKLPCKVGDTVHYKDEYSEFDFEVDKIIIDTEIRIFGGTRGCIVCARNFEKYCKLTGEAALRKSNQPEYSFEVGV